MMLTPHDQEAAAVADERASKIILGAIGDFSRATGNVERIDDPAERLKVLRLLADFVVHLTARIEAELARLGVAAQPVNQEVQQP